MNKRLNYFFGQFLKEKDFQDEQSYHINALSMHNKNAHSWGIASGLDASVDKSRKHVILDDGMAIDRNGRQIILEKPLKIDISKASISPVFLTISLNTTQTDPAGPDEASGNTRILEEPFIELEKSMPDNKSMNIFLAELKLDTENKTILSIDTSKRKIIGLSEDIKAKSITFTSNKQLNENPVIKGAKDAHLEIRSRKTSISGDMSIAGTLTAGKITGVLDRNTVGINQIIDESISISKIKSAKNMVTAEGSIDAGEEKLVAVEESNTHLFLVTSVIPTTTGKIEWNWQTEYDNNKLSYRLIIKNLSNKKVKYDLRYFDISEK
ncbi:MAG: hypothetical protein C3F06_11755 [Candidatus Methanoperedenaceae archaeon]|nr:MAG: hypothetical protein C3F06_11755 [Candidatus Methanoperedenaceae archaeon]